MQKMPITNYMQVAHALEGNNSLHTLTFQVNWTLDWKNYCLTWQLQSENVGKADDTTAMVNALKGNSTLTSFNFTNVSKNYDPFFPSWPAIIAVRESLFVIWSSEQHQESEDIANQYGERLSTVKIFHSDSFSGICLYQIPTTKKY